MKRTLAELLLVVVGFAAFTALLFHPMSFNLGSLTYNPENGDGQFSVWNVAWVARTLVADPRHVFDANIFYPHRWTLAYSEMNLAAGAIAVPAYWLTRSAYAAFNFALLSSFVLSATGMYYLCREITNDRRAAVIAAVPFAFCPFVFAHLLHIQLLMTAGLPLCLLALHRAIDRPSPARGAVLGAAMAFQAFACAYYAVFAILMVGLAVLVLASTRRLWTTRPFWLMLSTGAVVAIAASLPVLIAFQMLRDTGFARSLDAARMYSADWRAYLASGHTVHAWMLHYLQRWKEVLFPGFFAIAAGLAGLVIAWRRGSRFREVALVYGGGFVGLSVWASFGPDKGLYRLLYEVVPIFSALRAPSRFGIIVVFGLSVLAAIAVAAWLARSRRPALVTAGLLAVVIAEAWIVVPFEPSLVPHTGYRVLASQPHGAVLELPVYSRSLGFRRSRYMLDSTTHWMPLVDAYSDFLPPEFDERSAILANFPSADALRDLQRDRVRYAVIHLDAYDDPAIRRDLMARLAEFADYLRPIFQDPNLAVYEIVRYVD